MWQWVAAAPLAKPKASPHGHLTGSRENRAAILWSRLAVTGYQP